LAATDETFLTRETDASLIDRLVVPGITTDTPSGTSTRMSVVSARIRGYIWGRDSQI